MATRSKKRTAAPYTSDGGFVAPSDDEASRGTQSDDDGDSLPKAKKLKTEKPAHPTAPPTATSKAGGDAGRSVAGGGMRDTHGDEYWDLTTNRRVTISKYGGKVMVNVREYYEKDGQSLPGKKGISMPLAQFSTLIALLPHIETVLQQKGETVPRPEYDKMADGDDGPAAAGDDEDGEALAVVEKKNFEATSEEE